MELRSISFLRSLDTTQEALDNYINELVENYGWAEADIRKVIEDFRALGSTDDFIFLALKAFIVESYNEMAYDIVPPDRKFVSEEIYRVFKWTFQSQTHTLIMSNDRIEDLRVLFLLLDSGAFNPDLSQITPMSVLREDSRWRRYAQDLARLGLTGSEPIIPAPSDTLEIDESTARFSSAIWFEAIQEKTILLAGVGGIGRFGNLVNF